MAWIAAAFQVEREEDREALAALTLVIVEGLVVFDTLGDHATRADARTGITLSLIAAGRTPSSLTMNVRGREEGT